MEAQTNFFTQINKLLDNVDVSLTISKKEDKLIVLCRPVVHTKTEDPAINNLLPIQAVGTAEEFDKEFFSSISNPFNHIGTLVRNMKEFEDAEKKAEAESKAAKAVEDKKKAETLAIDKEADKVIKFLDENKEDKPKCLATIHKFIKDNSGKEAYSTSGKAKKVAEQEKEFKPVTTTGSLFNN